MAIRVGVDVGGTFTKAIAYDTDRSAVVAQAIVSTTHDHADGVAHGVVDVVGQVAAEVGATAIELVTHSTTQAVNALLEGDVAVVGLVGMGRAPDLRKARKRTTEVRIDLSDGKRMQTVTEFLDVTDGLDATRATEVVASLQARGAETIAVAEAFSPDDVTNESTIQAAATAAGLPVTTSAELTGLYGLELRAVTAALNASIVPIALRTADVVQEGVAAAGIPGSVMVMRGDGGATDLAGFRQAPTRTLYSGPAASVAGALRSGRIEDAVIVEVGGTSSNVAAIRRGRPALSYVQVASHATAIRSIDVRVIGVAGGSMLRVRRNKVYGVGPRSAHIAGFPYASYLAVEELAGATPELIAPRPGDAADYQALRLEDGRLVALTNTCACNALGIVEADDYAWADPAAASEAFAIVGRSLRLTGAEVARRMVQASAQAVGDLVTAVIASQHLERPSIVAVGGGAGALGRAVAAAMRLDVLVPPHSEVISAVGDALSLIRAERERTFDHPTSEDTRALVAEVEAEAIAAGANSASLDVRVEHVTERSAVRVTVTGAVGLSSGAVPGRPPASEESIRAAADERHLGAVRAFGSFWLAEADGRVATFDQYGDVVIDVRGERLSPPFAADAIEAAIVRRSRRMGPVTITPDAWIVSGARFMQVPEPSAVEILAALDAHTGESTIIVGRE